MKKTTPFILFLFAACLLSVPGAWAQTTAGYASHNQNDLLGMGVVGAQYEGNDFGSGVYGYASNTTGQVYGGYFRSDSENGSGVFATSFTATGETYGGLFYHLSNEGAGVKGYARAKNGYNFGGYFRSDSVTGTGVHGEAPAISDRVTYGGHFESASTKGVGVYGLVTSKTGKTYGGHFLTDSTTGGTAAVYGAARALKGLTYGGYFRTYSSNGRAVFGWARKNNFGSSGIGGDFKSDGIGGVGVWGAAESVSGENYGVYGHTSSPDGYGVYSSGNMKVAGSLKCTGTKSAVVNLKNGEGVTLYAVEASENWFEDFGSAKLKDGAAVVAIDPLYSETVNTAIDYHVFLTPRGECKGLYVTNQKNNSFEVRELNGGKSDIAFSYRIVAKRKGYEDVRLAKVKEEMMTAMVGAEGDGQKDEASGRLRKVK